MSQGWLGVLITGHIRAEPLSEQDVFSGFMRVELPTEIVESSSQGNLFLNRLVAVQGLGNQLIHIG